MVKEILEPVGKMDGDSLPVSAFVDHVDGQFELGAAAYEKRGVAVSVPTWDAAKCIQCNQLRLCLPPRHHPSLRSDRGGGQERPRRRQDRGRQGRQGQGRVQVHHGHQSRWTAWAAACAWASLPR